MRAGKPAVWKSHVGDGSWFWTTSLSLTPDTTSGWEPTWIDAVRALEKELTARRQVCEHGVGHPVVEDEMWKPDYELVHGCCGCCDNRYLKENIGMVI